MTRLRIVLQPTTEDGQVFYVNPPHIRSLTGTEKGALISLSDGVSLRVRERPEAIAGEIDRWMAAPTSASGGRATIHPRAKRRRHGRR